MVASPAVDRRVYMLVSVSLASLLWACPKSGPPCAFVDRGADAGRVVVSSGACMELACPAGSSPTATGRCACGVGLSPLLGACVSQETGDKLCGKSSRFADGACVPTPCMEGALDWESGLCLPQSAVDSTSRLKLEEDEHAACHSAGRAMVVAQGAPLCVPPSTLCGRGSRSHPASAPCGEPANCGAGEVLDESTDRCVRFVRADAGKYVVDVGQWTRAVLGPDGGSGTRVLCGPLFAAGSQLVYGRVDIRVDLSFPDNDISLVAPSIAVRSEDARAVPLALATSTVLQLVEPLRVVGGVASAGAVSTHIVCDLPALEAPMATRAGDSGLR